MKSASEIEQLGKGIRFRPNAAADERILGLAEAAFEKSSKTGSAKAGPNIWQTIYKSKITKLAVAAMIIVAIGLFLVQRNPEERPENDIKTPVAKSPAEMPTVASLNIAYHKGGLDAVERQCEKAFERLELRPADITLQELLAEFNGT